MCLRTRMGIYASLPMQHYNDLWGNNRIKRYIIAQIRGSQVSNNATEYISRMELNPITTTVYNTEPCYR